MPTQTDPCAPAPPVAHERERADVRPDVHSSAHSVAHAGATISRREFLETAERLAGVALYATFPIAVACAGRLHYVKPVAAGGRLSVPRSALPAAGSAVLVEDPAAELPIYLRRTGDNDYLAVSTRCMHRGCQVDAGADRLVCPCHGSEYAFDGAVLRGPTQQPLHRYRVTADGDLLHLTPLAPGER